MTTTLLRRIVNTGIALFYLAVVAVVATQLLLTPERAADHTVARTAPSASNN